MRLTRTQIYLEKAYYEGLKREAKAEDISLAELIRRIVKQHLSSGLTSKRKSKVHYMTIVGIGKSEAADGAEKHDRYVGEAVARYRTR